MINTGKPAPETDLGKKVILKQQELLQETRDWLRGWIPYCSNNREFGKRYKQILQGLTRIVNKLHDESLSDYEPIVFLYNCISYCNLNPDACVGSIKYCALYLESIYNDIYFRLQEDSSHRNVAETVKPTAERKAKKTKEQQYEKEQQKIYDREIDVGGGSL